MAETGVRCQHQALGFCSPCASFLLVKIGDLERGFLANTAKIDRIEALLQAACGWALDLGRQLPTNS